MLNNFSLTPEDAATIKRRRIVSIISIIIFIALSAAICWFVGKPLIEFVSEPDRFRLWVDSHGLWGRLAFVGMVVLQVIVAIIPGEPIEIGAGYAFGAFEGTLLCIIGAMIGTTIIFLFTRYFGIKVVDCFYPREKILSMKFFRNSKRLHLLVFILFFIPGTPKDIMTYVLGLTNMKLSACLLITSIARIPSVITSTVGGNALGIQDYQFAIIVFIFTIVVSVTGILIYRHMSKRLNEQDAAAEAVEPAQQIKSTAAMVDTQLVGTVEATAEPQLIGTAAVIVEPRITEEAEEMATLQPTQPVQDAASQQLIELASDAANLPVGQTQDN